jgi:hypothetical protein
MERFREYHLSIPILLRCHRLLLKSTKTSEALAKEANQEKRENTLAAELLEP